MPSSCERSGIVDVPRSGSSTSQDTRRNHHDRVQVGSAGPLRRPARPAHRPHQAPPLADLLVLALCAVLGGAESWPDSEAFGHAKRDFFKRFRALPHGIPSHDTFRRVLAALNPAKCAAGFSSWMAALCDACGRVPIAIDGKALRRSPTATASGCLPLVSAWATANHLSLGQQEVEEGSKESTAIAERLRVLDLKGALGSIDAAGGQVEIAQQIRAQGGDYLLAVKGNQPALHEACERLLLEALETDCAGRRHDLSARSEDGHGRHEERYVTGLEDPVGLPPAWVDVKALVAVRRERPVKDKDSSERQLSLSSSRGRAKRLGAWCVGTGESSRACTGYGTWSSARTTTGRAARAGRTWGCCGGWPCRCSSVRRARAAFIPSVSRQAGTMTSY